MKAEQQRIAIAEACGWTRTDGGFSEPLFVRGTFEAFVIDLPDYLNDLNAIHLAEVEEIWGAGIGHQYIDELGRVCTERHPLYATAAQRAEAFLRTLNKWEETK